MVTYFLPYRNLSGRMYQPRGRVAGKVCVGCLFPDGILEFFGAKRCRGLITAGKQISGAGHWDKVVSIFLPQTSSELSVLPEEIGKIGRVDQFSIAL